MSALICANLDCPTKGQPQRACYQASVVIAEGHVPGKQKKIRVHLCFDCYHRHSKAHSKTREGMYPRSD